VGQRGTAFFPGSETHIVKQHPSPTPLKVEWIIALLSAFVSLCHFVKGSSFMGEAA